MSSKTISISIVIVLVSYANCIPQLNKTDEQKPKRQPPLPELLEVNEQQDEKVGLSPGDPNSYARPKEVKTSHIHIDWDIHFDKNIVDGICTYTMEKVDPKVNVVIMDVKGLNISSIQLKSTGEDLKYTIDGDTSQGSRLQIQLPAETSNQFKMAIKYSTTSLCTALLWMRPEQTAGGVHPFMFSQNEAIHARSLMPCQDTPSVKSTYSANVTAPKGITVLMSAIRKSNEPEPVGEKFKFSFEQNIPVMSYLIAIAAGDLKSRKIGPRSHVWAEEKFVDLAAQDFSETENMIQTAEDICGPYVWGIYDILVLPPSFPYGGMENPCLTFVSSTLLSGDKANANVIAHEIAHSWAGNLVTNKNFDHFWLNEGFTSFIEQKIKGRLQGEPLRHFSAILSWSPLSETVNDVLGADNPFTKLVPDLRGVNPDEAFSSVPYVKGSSFLWYLENKVDAAYIQFGGDDEFEHFLRSYLENFKYQSITTDMFKAYFLQYFANSTLTKDIDWDAWLYGTGMPPVKPDWDDSLARPCYNLSARWQAWNADVTGCPFHEDDIQSFLPEQTVEFLNSLLSGEPLSSAAVDKLTQLYKFSQSKNMEIIFRWIRIGIAARYEKSVPAAIDLITNVGRMKYVRPIYRDLYAWPEKRQVALETFEANKARMMAVTRERVAKDLHITE